MASRGIFALQLHLQKTGCEDSSIPLRSTRNDSVMLVNILDDTAPYQQKQNAGNQQGSRENVKP